MSSIKFYYDLFETLENASKDGKDIEVKWFYHKDDDMALEAGEDFQEDYEDLTNPGIVYEVSFMKGTFLLKDYQMDLLGKQQLFNFMYDFSHIAKMREEQEFVEPLE